MIICIEGITNSGKSSLCKLLEQEQHFVLANKLQKSSIVAQRIKAVTGPVENIGKFDSNTELLLYSTLLSDKSHSVQSLHGDIVIDRFALSVFSYFSARYGIDESTVKIIVDYASRGIIPDVTFFLDVSLETIMQRAIKSPFTRKDIGLENYYYKLRENYISHIDDFSKKSYIIACDSMSIEEIYKYVCECLDWR